MNHNCIVVLGPTASGKTKLACRLAHHINGEVISSDSRQVYKYLDIGTGKDLNEYKVNGRSIPYHLIDICEPSEQFFLHQYMRTFEKSFNTILAHGKMPIICGGTGLYLDILHKDFSFTQIKENLNLRKELSFLTKEELILKLSQFPKEFTRHVDLNSQKRIIRGIEVADYRTKNDFSIAPKKLPYKPIYLGISVKVEERKKRITERLNQRLNDGLIEEVETLIKNGLTNARLETLGLEYKFVSYYLQQKISRQELFIQLQTAIFQFAKRQTTWFRKMENEGVKINWVDPDYKIDVIVESLRLT